MILPFCLKPASLLAALIHAGTKPAVLARSIAAALVVSAVTQLAAPSASALWFDGGSVDIAATGDGAAANAAGTWSTSIANWDQGSGLAHVVWTNSATALAVFGGGDDIYTLGSDVTVNRINAYGSGISTFNAGGGPFKITLGGTTAVFSVGANTTTGRTSVVNVEITGASALQILGPTTTPGGSVNLNKVNTFTGALTVNNTTLNIGSGGTAGQLNSGAYGNTISLATTAASFTYSSSLDQILSGVISGTGKLTKGFSAGSTLTLSGNNTYTGVTAVNAGTLQIGTGGATGTLGNNSNTSVAAGATLQINRSATTIYAYGGSLSGSGTVENVAGSRFDLSANQTGSSNLAFINDGILGIRSGVSSVTDVQLGELSGSGSIVRGSSAGGAATLSIGGKNTSSTYSGTIGSTELSVSKVGSGVLTLSGSNTYGGLTSVNAGTLLVSGSITGAVEVNTGGTLGSSSGVTGGSVGALVVKSGGTLAPGAGTGVLTASSTTFDGGTFALEISGTQVVTGYDQLSTGALNLTVNSPLTLSLGAFDPADDGSMSFIVINNTGTAPMTGTGLFTLGGTPLNNGDTFTVESQMFSIMYNGGVDSNDVILTAIPEPSAALALMSGMAVLLGLRRRRRP